MQNFLSPSVGNNEIPIIPKIKPELLVMMSFFRTNFVKVAVKVISSGTYAENEGELYYLQASFTPSWDDDNSNDFN
jgi:hypothetical protein